MADDAYGFNAWDPRTWKNVHEMPHQFAQPESFEKTHQLADDEAYLYYEPGDKQTKFVLKRMAWTDETTEVRSEDDGFVFTTKRDSDDEMSILDKDGNIAAVCVKVKVGIAEKDVYVLSTKPLYAEQVPDKKHKVGLTVLYRWATIKKDPSCPTDINAYKLTMEKKGGIPIIGGLLGQGGTTYIMNEDFKNYHPTTHARVIRRKKGEESVAMFSPYKSSTWGESGGYKVLVAPGIDPIMMLCFLATKDYLKG